MLVPQPDIWSYGALRDTPPGPLPHTEQGMGRLPEQSPPRARLRADDTPGLQSAVHRLEEGLRASSGRVSG